MVDPIVIETPVLKDVDIVCSNEECPEAGIVKAGRIVEGDTSTEYICGVCNEACTVTDAAP